MKIKKQTESEILDEKPKHKSDKSLNIKNDKEAMDKPPKKKLSKLTIWTINITLITFILSAFFSLLSEITTSNAHIIVAFLLLILLVVFNIIFDAVGVASTACELAPLLSMASRKIKGSRTAIKLVKNAERVSNICCDVFGDICGIVSGSCTLAIVIKITASSSDKASFWISILFSSIVAALTVGGKAIFKELAVKHSQEIIMFVSKLLSVFERGEKKKKKGGKQ